ncbi:hypothetical protein P4S68_20650 [Pseudoalteromonas sp. Hal099]
MAAYVLLLVSFPVQMTAWLPVTDLLNAPIGFLDQLRLIFTDFYRSGL